MTLITILFNLDLFDTSQYCTLEGAVLIPTITPESGADCDDFYQMDQEKSDSKMIPELAANNLYGHEFLSYNEAQEDKKVNYATCDYGYNLPPQTIIQHSESSGIFSSWKTSSTQNPIPKAQIDPNTGLPRKICSNCGSISTPSWRRCPEGRNLLCNACGLYQKLHNRPRPLRIREDGSVQVIRNSSSTSRNVCQNCKTTETPIWRRNQGDRTLLLCNACALYLKNHNSSRPSNYTYNDDERKNLLI